MKVIGRVLYVLRVATDLNLRNEAGQLHILPCYRLGNGLVPDVQAASVFETAEEAKAFRSTMGHESDRIMAVVIEHTQYLRAVVSDGV